jgi:hypothetical protein
MSRKMLLTRRSSLVTRHCFPKEQGFERSR